MVSETTVEATSAKDVPMKSTGREKVCVFVCLAAKLDETEVIYCIWCFKKRVEIIT